MNSEVDEMDYVMHPPEHSPTFQPPQLQPQQGCPAADWRAGRVNTYMSGSQGPFLPSRTPHHPYYDPVHATSTFNNHWSVLPQAPSQPSRLPVDPYFTGANPGFAGSTIPGLPGYMAHHHIPSLQDPFSNHHSYPYRQTASTRSGNGLTSNSLAQPPPPPDRNGHRAPRASLANFSISTPPPNMNRSTSGQSSPTAIPARAQPFTDGHELRFGDHGVSETFHTSASSNTVSFERRDVLPQPHRSVPSSQQWPNSSDPLYDERSSEITRRIRANPAGSGGGLEDQQERFMQTHEDYQPSPRYMAGGGHAHARQNQLIRGQISNKRVASRSAIASLLSVDISSLPESERTCVICYNEFGVNSPEGVNEAPLRLPKCKHVFGDHCIKKWFLESDSCPYCRDKVPSETPGARSTPEQIRQYFASSRRIAAASAAAANGGQTSSGWGQSDMEGLYRTYMSSHHGLHDNFRDQRGSPPSSWSVAGERRSPPDDSSESRRRQRPRHGSSSSGTPSSNISINISSVDGSGNRPSSFAGAMSNTSTATSHHHIPYHRVMPRQQQPPVPSNVLSFSTLGGFEPTPVSDPPIHQRQTYLPSIPFVNSATQTESQSFHNPLNSAGTSAGASADTTTLSYATPPPPLTPFSQQLPPVSLGGLSGPAGSGYSGTVRPASGIRSDT